VSSVSVPHEIETKACLSHILCFDVVPTAHLHSRTHPYFISKEAYKELINETGTMNEVTTADWVKETINTWRHTVYKGVKDPRGWIFKPKTYVKCFRDAYCLERMHRAFKRGLMEYGMLTATKKM
jgi:MPBQ/MSBQ methyltransferase